jgi:hypothetical protein
MIIDAINMSLLRGWIKFGFKNRHLVNFWRFILERANRVGASYSQA